MRCASVLGAEFSNQLVLACERTVHAYFELPVYSGGVCAQFSPVYALAQRQRGQIERAPGSSPVSTIVTDESVAGGRSRVLATRKECVSMNQTNDKPEAYVPTLPAKSLTTGDGERERPTVDGAHGELTVQVNQHGANASEAENTSLRNVSAIPAGTTRSMDIGSNAPQAGGPLNSGTEGEGEGEGIKESPRETSDVNRA